MVLLYHVNSVGLIPDRKEKMTLLRELTRLFTPVPAHPAPSTAPMTVSETLPHIINTQTEEESEVSSLRARDEHGACSKRLNTHPPVSISPISATVNWNEEKVNEKGGAERRSVPVSGVVTAVDPPVSKILETESLSPFRLHQYSTEKTSKSKEVPLLATAENDPDYIETLAKCNMKDYYGNMEKTYSPRVHQVRQRNGDDSGAEYSRKRMHTLPMTNSQWSSSPRMAMLLQLSQTKKAAWVSKG